jgi:hypothetical protein
MPMRSFVKIYGPPLADAIKVLEKIAIDTPQVCIMDTMIATAAPAFDTVRGIQDYFAESGRPVSKERCNKIISKSGEMLGEYDFFFEWFKDPNQKEINDLITKIDAALTPLGCKYTITTKK